MPITPADDNGVRMPDRAYVALMLDEYGKPIGICAIGQGNYVEVRLDRAQLEAFSGGLIVALA
jgi:hypothetical protein